MAFYLRLHNRKLKAVVTAQLPISFKISIPLITIGPKGILPKWPKNVNGLFIDPGSKNFALCNIKNDKVQSTHLLKNTIRNIRAEDFGFQYNSFVGEINGIINFVRPELIVIERFMPRGFGGNSLELIGYMNAVITELCRAKGIHIHLISAGQWKTKLSPYLDLKELYKEVKREYKLAPHNIDSMCIGRYTINGNKFSEADKAWIKSNIKNCTKPIVK
jgi:Holliday junction resolvasome RuvABC endonuclease subunit